MIYDRIRWLTGAVQVKLLRAGTAQISMQRRREEKLKYIRQFGIILFISFIGEILHELLPLPIPASIYGIVLLFLCLELKVISVSSVKEVSGFLIEAMPIMFIPAAAGLMDSWPVIKDAWVSYAVITVLSTFVVMAVSGRVVQFVMRRSEKDKTEEEESKDERAV